MRNALWITSVLACLSARAAAQPSPPEGIELVRNVVFSQATAADGSPVDLTLDAAFPRGAERPLPAVIYIHGGSYRAGSKEAGRTMMFGLADGGYFAVSINYRLSGTAPFPAAVHDCKAAVRFLRANAQELGLDPKRIGAIGHSAGGHLSTLLAVTGNDSGLDGDLEPLGVPSSVCCAVDISGPVDLGPHAGAPGSPLRRWLGEDDQTYQRNARAANPLGYVDAQDPPLLIVHGADDDVVSPNASRTLKQTLDAAGATAELLIVEGEGHMLADPAAYLRMAAFFDQHMGGNAAARLAARQPAKEPGPGP